MVLSPVLGKLVSKRVVLASASPRRQEILTNVVSAAEPLFFPPLGGAGAGGGPAWPGVGSARRAEIGTPTAAARVLFLGRAWRVAACLSERPWRVCSSWVGLVGVLLLSELSTHYTCVHELTRPSRFRF